MKKRKFTFEIWKEDDWWLADCWVEGNNYMTCAKIEDAIFDMVADLCKTVLDIPCSLY